MSFSSFDESLYLRASLPARQILFTDLRPFSFHRYVFNGRLPYGKSISFSNAFRVGSSSLAYLFLSELTRSNIRVAYISPINFGYLSAYELGVNFNNLIMIDCIDNSCDKERYASEKLRHVLSVLIKGSGVIAINSSFLMTIKNLDNVMAKLRASRAILIVLDAFNIETSHKLNQPWHLDYVISPVENTFKVIKTSDDLSAIDTGRFIQRQIRFHVTGRRIYKPVEFSLILPQIPLIIKESASDNLKLLSESKSEVKQTVFNLIKNEKQRQQYITNITENP
jgi:hypothetical protein